MKKWAITGFVYLLLVIGGYTIYDAFFNNHSEAANEDEMSGHSHGLEQAEKSGEVNSTLTYKEGTITITLKDQNGVPVDQLLVNHEKLLHLIVVDEELNQYNHLHPKKIGKGKFEIIHKLADGTYKAFIDVKPENLNYRVTPVVFTVGKHEQSDHHYSLEVDQNLKKTIEGKTVELKVSSFESGKPVILTYTLQDPKLEPYLGAAGHVVILDEKGEQYLHVHPHNEKEPIFETEFNHPGKYKIWAEFKQDGKVRVYPFVIEIK